MEMFGRVTIRGAKKFVGNVNGNDIDSGTIFTDVELRGEDSKGVCTQAMKCENSEVVKRVLNNPFPFIAELVMRQTSNGKADGDQVIVTEIKPIQRVTEGEAKKGPQQ